MAKMKNAILLVSSYFGPNHHLKKFIVPRKEKNELNSHN